MYMSPEVVLCRGHNTKTDIYSLGTTIIHMQTGSPPWVLRYPRTAYPSYLYIVSTAHFLKATLASGCCYWMMAKTPQTFIVFRG